MGRVRINTKELPVPLKELPEYIKHIMNKEVSELTSEDLWALREWMLLHRSKRSIAVDLRFGSKRVPSYVSTWIEHEGKRYDIPGVDTPNALPYLEKMGYHPRYRKKKQKQLNQPAYKIMGTEPENIEQKLAKIYEEITRKDKELCEKLKTIYNILFEAELYYPEWSKLYAELEKKYGKNIVGKIYGLIQAIANNYGLTMNSYAVKEANMYLSMFRRDNIDDLIERLSSMLYSIMRYLNIKNIVGAMKSNKTEYQRLIDLAVNGLIRKYFGEKEEQYMPEIISSIRKGLEEIAKNPEILENLLKEAWMDYGETYYNINLSTAVMPEDVLNTAQQYNYLLSLAYIIGKGINVSNINSIRREAYRVAREFIKEYGDVFGNDTVKTLARLMRSTKYPLSRVIPALAEALILLEPSIKDFIKKLGWQGKLGIENELYYKSPYTDMNTPYGIIGLIREIDKLMRAKEYIEKITGKPEFLIEELKKYGIQPRMDGLELRIGVGKIDVIYNGEKLGEIRLDREHLYSIYITNDFNPASLIETNILIPLEQMLRAKNLYLYSGRDKTFLVRYSDRGAEILYPEHIIVPYSDITRYYSIIRDTSAVHDFKLHAVKHGFSYTTSPAYPEAIEEVMSNEGLGLRVYKTIDNDYLAVYSAGITQEHARAKTPLEAIYSVALKLLEEGKPKKAEQILEYAEKIAKNTSNNTLTPEELERVKHMAELSRLLSTQLAPFSGSTGAFINSTRTILVSPSLSKELKTIIERAELTQVPIKETRIYVEAEKPYNLNEKEARRNGIEVHEYTIHVPINKYSRALLKKLGIRYPEYASSIIIEYNGMKYRYPENIYKALKKAKEIYLSKKETSSPMIIKYNNTYIAVAPQVETEI